MIREFPPIALLKPIARCRYRPRRPTMDGKLGAWGNEYRLPALSELAGEADFAQYYLAWNGRGLYLALDVPKEAQVVVNRQNPSAGDALDLFIDTRATQTSHRATRFCHHFVVLPAGGGSDRSEAIVRQVPIRRALQRAPLADPEHMAVASKLRADGYSLELALRTEALHGYEPEEGGRIGLALVLHDIQRGRRFWGTAEDFPYARDPSTWSLIELVK